MLVEHLGIISKTDRSSTYFTLVFQSFTRLLTRTASNSNLAPLNAAFLRINCNPFFLRHWLLNNWSGIVSYAREIFLYVWDRHIHDSQSCDTRGMRVSGYRW